MQAGRQPNRRRETDRDKPGRTMYVLISMNVRKVPDMMETFFRNEAPLIQYRQYLLLLLLLLVQL